MPKLRVEGGIARAFTLVELIAVIVVLGVLAGVAIPKYIDHSSNAKAAADAASIAGVNTALNHAYLQHRMNDAPSGQWITAVSQISAQMHSARLPEGITIAGAQLVDRRGNLYTFTAETATTPSRVVLAGGGGGS